VGFRDKVEEMSLIRAFSYFPHHKYRVFHKRANLRLKMGFIGGVILHLVEIFSLYWVIFNISLLDEEAYLLKRF
jgi:hypothetical protein